MDTLNEQANAQANDANYATTIQNQLALQANQSTTYTNGEVDTSCGLLGLTGNQLTIYTKIQVDREIDKKAHDSYYGSSSSSQVRQVICI